MSRASTLSRLQRLDLLTSRLKSGEPLILGEVAEELGVSLRTLSRDIALLREQGVPVDADRGRGGGVRLDWRWGVGRMNLSYAEAVDTLIAIAIAERMQSALLLSQLSTVRRKLIASFAPSLRDRVASVTQRIRIGGAASVAVLSNAAEADRQTMEPLSQAFLTQRVLDISYAAEGGAISQRPIEAQYLFLNYPVWYVLAWDRMRKGVRTFRCDRIETARVLDEEFRAMPFSVFEQAVEGAEMSSP